MMTPTERRYFEADIEHRLRDVPGVERVLVDFASMKHSTPVVHVEYSADGIEEEILGALARLRRTQLFELTLTGLTGARVVFERPKPSAPPDSSSAPRATVWAAALHTPDAAVCALFPETPRSEITCLVTRGANAEEQAEGFEWCASFRLGGRSRKAAGKLVHTDGDPPLYLVTWWGDL